MKNDQITNQILKKAKSNNKDKILDTWFFYLSDELKFPYEAEVQLFSYSRNLKDSDIVKVLGVDNLIDMYGVLMKIKFERSTYFMPLEELIVKNKNSKNYKIIDAFLEWYANNYC